MHVAYVAYFDWFIYLSNIVLGSCEKNNIAVKLQVRAPMSHSADFAGKNRIL